MTSRIPAFDYLRAFVIVLVVLHHSTLAYTTFMEFNSVDPVANTNPVDDDRQWLGFDLIVLFNDTWFMSLLFFVSGLFVWGSLERKGPRSFLRDRLVRLGIPYVIGVPLLIPLAIFPAQLIARGPGAGLYEFWSGMARTGFRTDGHLWFLWVLLSFNVLAAVLYRLAPHAADIIRSRAAFIMARPTTFFWTLTLASTIAWLPLASVFGAFHWTVIGPFHFQTSRIILYVVYFLAGTMVGAYGLEDTWLTSKSAPAKYWWLWLLAGIIAWVNIQPFYLLFTVSCAAVVFGVIGAFLRFAQQRTSIMDSLSDNAYGIYIFHYVFSSWLQYGMLAADLHAVHKAAVVFAGTLMLSWGSSAAIRRVPAVARII